MTQQPAKILVVDAEPAIRFTLKYMLERSGWAEAFIELAERFDTAMASEQLDAFHNQ